MHSHLRQNNTFTDFSGGQEALFAAPHRFSFNGKESDSEVKGEGNSLDFGARVYDSRLGRWMAMDPLHSNHPNWSTYKAFLNNPIVYIDPDGRTEFITTITVNASTGEVKITISTANKIMTDGIEQSPPIHQGNPFHVQRNYYDFETLTLNVVDNNGKVLATSTSTKILYQNGIKDKDRIVLPGQGHPGHTKIEDIGKELPFGEGDGYQTDAGGFTLVTKGETVSPTKIRTTADTEKIDIDLLISAVGGINSGRGETEKSMYFADAADKILKVIEGVKEIIKDYKVYEICNQCNKVIGPNEDHYTAGRGTRDSVGVPEK